MGPNRQINIEMNKAGASQFLTLKHSTKLQSSKLYGTRQTGQWNRTENPEINPHNYGKMIIDKGTKTRDILQLSTCKRMKLVPYIKQYTKIKSKWIKDLHVRPEPIKLLEENIGENLHIYLSIISQI